MSIKAAGILPISIDYHGNIVFLLGQEHFQYDWDEEGTWCGFGGSLEEGETIEEGAAREFEEESMALLADQEEMLGILNSERLIISYHNGKYQEFVVYFDYDEKLPRQFQRVYNYFHRCAVEHPNKRPMKYIPSCPGGYSEKISIQWVKLNDLKERKINNLRPCFERTIYPMIGKIESKI